MTRKDYKLIAKVIQEAVPLEKMRIRNKICRHFCQALQAENPLFDREKFEAAVWSDCGLTVSRKA